MSDTNTKVPENQSCGFSVSYQKDAQPSIQWKHIDGPLLHLRNGQCHWLTIWERIQYACGWITIRQLERKWWGRWNEL